uniref:Uncharacterized protein n=1 Tax=Anopheles melas TaxID=34690 RepID=A0A182TRY2_9DIPT
MRTKTDDVDAMTNTATTTPAQGKDKETVESPRCANRSSSTIPNRFILWCRVGLVVTLLRWLQLPVFGSMTDRLIASDRLMYALEQCKSATTHPQTGRKAAPHPDV